MKIIINATDVHSGGGKVMLSDLLSAAIEKDNAEFHVFTDPRYNRQNYSAVISIFIKYQNGKEYL